MDVRVAIFRIVIIAVEIVVQYQEKPACGHYQLWIFMKTSLCDDLNRLFIIPNFPFVEFDHDIQGPTACSLIWILHHPKDEILQFSIDIVDFMVLIELLQIADNYAV